MSRVDYALFGSRCHECLVFKKCVKIVLFGYNMSYAYRAATPCAPCGPRVAVVAAAPCAKPDPCAIPQHTETVDIPHHVYALKSQTVTRRWVEHSVQMRKMPVTQEQQVTALPPVDVCVSAPCPPQPCAAPRAAAYGYRY